MDIIKGNELFDVVKKQGRTKVKLLTDATHSIMRFPKGAEFIVWLENSWSMRTDFDTKYQDIFITAIRSDNVELLNCG